MSSLKEKLLAYDPARGAVDESTAAAAAEACDDAELAAWLEAEQAFDAAFKAKLETAPVPAGLAEQIIAAAAADEKPTPAPVIAGETESKGFWLHGGLLAMAAMLMAFLALAFTFVFNPAQRAADAQTLALMEQIEELSRDLKPQKRDGGFEALAQFVADRGAPTPSFLPESLEAAEGYACQVMEIDGHPVGVICFKDGEQTYHLFTMSREAVPQQQSLLQPAVHDFGGRDCASWTCEKYLYVLTGDESVEPMVTRL